MQSTFYIVCTVSWAKYAFTLIASRSFHSFACLFARCSPSTFYFFLASLFFCFAGGSAIVNNYPSKVSNFDLASCDECVNVSRCHSVTTVPFDKVNFIPNHLCVTQAWNKRSNRANERPKAEQKSIFWFYLWRKTRTHTCTGVAGPPCFPVNSRNTFTLWLEWLGCMCVYAFFAFILHTERARIHSIIIIEYDTRIPN